MPSLGIVALHPPVTLHISPLGHGAGVQRHPRRCVYSSGAVPPRPDPIAMCSLKGSERSQTESQSDAVLPQSIFAHTETSVHLCALSDSRSSHSRLQTATMATHAVGMCARRSDARCRAAQEVVVCVPVVPVGKKQRGMQKAAAARTYGEG